MKKLLEYLNGLAPAEQADYAERCRTTVGYLRKAASIQQRLNEGLCIRLDKESGGAVPCEALRPDMADYFAYLRNSRQPAEESAHA